MVSIKRQLLCPLAGGILGAAAALLAQAWTGSEALSLLTAPGNILGDGLRNLSLSGRLGNLAAWAIVLLISALPLLWFSLRRSREHNLTDWLLCLLAPELFLLFYSLVNPSLIASPAAVFFPVAVAGTVLATLLSWLILRLLRWMDRCPAQRLGVMLQTLLAVCSALLAFSAVCTQLSDCLTTCANVTEGNTAQPGTARFTCLVLGIFCLLKVLPYLLSSIVLLWGGQLARTLGRTAFDRQALDLCGKTAQGCRWIVQVTVLLLLLRNLLQLALFSHLTETHFSVELPLFPLLLSAALLLLCRCLRQGQALQEDNNSII